MNPASGFPNLNWRELAQVTPAAILTPSAENPLFVERVVIPERPQFSAGYLKGEWCLRLTSRHQEYFLIFSVRPRAPYLLLSQGKSPKAALGSTQSSLGLALAKHLKGARLLSLELPPRERTLILWFSAQSLDFEGLPAPARRLGLVLTLIPALPEALLIVDIGDSGQPGSLGYPILARSRTVREGGEPEGPKGLLGRWICPDGSKAPAEPAVREEIVQSYSRLIQQALDREAFESRLRAARKIASEACKQAQDRSRQSHTAMTEAQKEAPWRHYGDLLKAQLGSPPPLILDPPVKGRAPTAHRLLPDYTLGLENSLDSEAGAPLVRVPCDPKLSPSAQVEKFYHLAKRRQRREDEARSRWEQAQEAERKFQGFLEQLQTLEQGEIQWRSLEALELKLGIQPAAATGGSGSAKIPKHALTKNRWLGKVFLSKDGFQIWIGRSRDENLELTFKHARGNDLWLHVRGRPGAHTVIPIPTNKSAPLDTLLDAAVLTLFYSGGEKWGKTEVDYTFKKYVKRIKDSTEASYTQNKTLLIEIQSESNQARLRRLLAQGGG